MAEVRPIPSAVGAFEAQVIDFNKTYNAIVQNASSIKKRQVQAQKDIEKQMDVALADKRAIRPQDSDYVEEKRQDVYNYYFQNRDNIMAGGKAAGELKMKMGEFTSAVNQSSSLNRRGMSLNPAWKEAMKDENQMDDGLTEVQRVWSLPINDPNRKDAKFDRGGFQASIDEFDVPDISYYKKFNEVKDIYEPITKNVKPFPISSMELKSNKKLDFYVDETTTILASNPIEIANTVTAAVSGSKARGFLSDYGKQLAVYKSLPQEDKDLELKGVIDAYKELPRGVDMTSWFSKEGGPGIDNELELAVFKQLQNALPQVVKTAYDYRTQNAVFRQWQQNFSASKFNWIKSQTVTLDQNIVNSIKSGKFKASDINSYLDPMFNAGNPATGGVRAADVRFSDPDDKGNITITHITNTPLKAPDGTLIKDPSIAASYNNPTAGITVKLSPFTNVYYAEQVRTDVTNKKDPALGSKVTTALDRAENSISIEQIAESVKGLRNPVGNLRFLMPGVTQPAPSSGSEQSVKMNQRNK
jgi:hypothetical protein